MARRARLGRRRMTCSPVGMMSFTDLPPIRSDSVVPFSEQLATGLERILGLPYQARKRPDAMALPGISAPAVDPHDLPPRCAVGQRRRPETTGCLGEAIAGVLSCCRRRPLPAKRRGEGIGRAGRTDG